MKKGIITTYAMLVYALVFIIASVGAIYHGINSSEHIFTIAGVLNFIFGGWTAYKVWRNDNPKAE